MKQVWIGVLAAGVVAGLSARGEAGPTWQLAVTVEEPAGVARTAEPVSGGIPLMAGAFKADQAFALFDGAREVPVQVLPLVVDADGYLRWILVDTQVSLAAREKKTLTLRAVKGSAAPASPLRVTDGPEAVSVDTGRIQFTVSKRGPFSLFSSVKAGGRDLVTGGEASYLDVTKEEKRGVAGPPASVVVEYAGPLRTTVCVKGHFTGDEQTQMRYIARITAWAGRSDVHVKYSLANSNEQHYTWRRIKDSSIRLNLAGPPAGTIVGTSKPLEAGAEVWLQQSARVVKAAAHTEDLLGDASWLHQTPGAAGPGAAKAASGAQDLWVSQGKGDVAEGWLAVRAGGGLIAVNDLYFVEDPPRRLATAGGALVLSGIAPILEGTKSPFGDENRWLADCSHLSSQYVIDFQAQAQALSAAAKASRGALHLLAPLSWYFETEALPVGTFGTQADELKCYDLWGWKYDPKSVPKSTVGRLANMPRFSGGDDNHYTSEQDTLDGLLLMYLRTGERAFFDAAQSWANYFMDLQAWRTDGWRWKDGGVWWTAGGPLGSSPQRGKDPVTGQGGSVPPPWSKVFNEPFNKGAVSDLWFLANAKACYCHNWGEGVAEWFLVTGDRDSFETAIDCAEQNYDTQRRAFRRVPGQGGRGFSRDFTRACYLTNSTRLIAPTDPFVVEASDYLMAVFLQRPNPEVRGFLNGPSKIDMKTLEAKVGPNGLARMSELGVTLDAGTGELVDPKTGARWMPVADPHTWMFPPLSRAMEVYDRISGNEDGRDWLIAYGQAVARVLFQEKHGNLAYGHFLVDFPVKGFAWDRHSWNIPAGVKDGEGEAINGYLAQFYPDVPARAYELCGDPFLKQRAYDYWYYGSHRGYNAKQMHNIGGVGKWVNVYTTHDESVSFTGKTIYVWAHPKQDDRAPAAVKDLRVAVAGDKATVTFTAPADVGGGKVVRYQVKCSEKPIVDYETFLRKFAANEDGTVMNWWMAANLTGEPAPKAAGTKESFTVSGVPAGGTYFAVVAYDDSSNRSALSNVAGGE